MKKMMMLVAALFGAVQAWGETWSQMTLTHISSSSSVSGQGAEKLFDNKTSTKWCSTFSANSTYVEFSASAGVLGKIELYAAEDTSTYTGRNWKSWTLYGWNGSSWVSINAWANRTPTTTYGYYTWYTFSNSTAYPKYKLVLNANHGDTYQQMADLRIYTDTSRSSSTIECSSWGMVKANLDAGNSVKLTANISIGSSQNQAFWRDSSTAADVSLDLNGKTIDAYNGSNAAGEKDRLFILYSTSNFKLTIKDSVGGGSIVGHKQIQEHYGGMIWIDGSSQLVLDSGTISGFSTTGAGGAICVNAGSFTMNGGTISGCKSSGNGGAVFSSGTTKIYGGSFLKNSSEWGGALYANQDTYIYVYGGYFSGNTANSGGASFMGWSGKKLGRLYGGVFADGDPTGDAQSKGCLVFALTDFVTKVTSVNSKYVVGQSISSSNGKLTGGTYTFDPAASEYVASGCCIAPGKVATVSNSKWTIGSASSTSPFQASTWNYAKINLEGGYNVKLTGSVNQDSTCTIPSSKGTMTFDLNGYTINRTASTQAFYVNSGNTFTIKNGTFDGKNFTFKADGHFLRSYATTTLDGVTIKNCKNNANNYWGTLYIPSGTLTMKGGRLQDCTTVGNGGGAYVDGGTFIMTSGAVIASCTSSLTGGGVYVSSGTFTLADGTISSCTASNNGGGVYVSSGTMTMSGGTISTCASSTQGGAVYNASTFKMNGGTISSCTATSNGGAVYNTGTFTMNGGVLTGNKASGSSTSASAIIYNTGTATVNGGVSVNSHIGDFKASGKECKLVGSKYIVGTGIASDANNKLIAGTYTFCPTDAEYAAAGVALVSGSSTQKAGDLAWQIVSGTSAGDNVMAYLADGVCTIHGTGATANENPLAAQWASVKDVRIAGGVTSLGENFFYKFYNLTNVTIAASCTSLDEGAFFRCLSLEQVTFEGSTLPELGENALPVRAAIKMVEGKPVVTMVPKVTVGDKEPTLQGSNDLSTWENVAAGNEKNYHFFKYVLGN